MLSNMVIESTYYTFNYFGNIQYNTRFKTEAECREYLDSHSMRMLDVLKVDNIRVVTKVGAFKGIRHKGFMHDEYCNLFNGKINLQCYASNDEKIMVAH